MKYGWKLLVGGLLLPAFLPGATDARPAPLFTNGTVVRVNERAGTVSFRSGTEERTALVAPAMRERLAGLRPGQAALFGVEPAADGRSLPLVTVLRVSTPTIASAAVPPATAAPATARSSSTSSSVAESAARLNGTASSRGTAISSIGSGASASATRPGIASPAGTSFMGGGASSSEGGGIPLAYVTDPIPSIPRATADPDGGYALNSTEPMGTAGALAGTAASLALQADQIDRAWSAYRDQCTTAGTPIPVGSDREWFVLFSNSLPSPSDDGCRRMLDRLTEQARSFRARADAVEDAARQAGVLPGTVRDTFGSYNISY
jgi:hypothetical protein